MRSIRVLGALAGVTLFASAAAAQQPLPVYSPVSAAPAPPPAYDAYQMYGGSPVYSWDGLYAGAFLGWGNASITGTLGGTTETWAANGFQVGAQVGMNWQFGQWVLGIQTEVGWMFGTGASSAGFAGGVSTSLGLIGSFRVRGGYAWNDWLFYGSIGPSWQRVIASGGGVITPDPNSQLHPGFIIGVGVEKAINDAMRARFEIDWSRYNDGDYGGGVSLTPNRRLDFRFSLLFPITP